ncbi:O-succinylbenzoic acid--CoA ligase [Balneicella halophila]|uniref:O-succinylbenzoic acid--CoA ligase n=1 Tax=Balneicella halophila TaxID=1537566 RepID=A0A7L4UPX3_BALHA|nr:AMP-binding protein [Balneicella halophila]PVX51793.1 O-succinylbenzoic acid--CoA ligase [Balneicella halophila]
MLLDFSQYAHPEDIVNSTNEFDEKVLLFIRKWHSQKKFTVHTSGSTSTPKSIVHTKEAMVNSAKLTGVFFQFQKGNTALLCLPVTKIAGMMMVVRAIVWKLKLYTLPPKFKLDLNSLPKITFGALIPPQAIENFEHLDRIKTILLGGAGVPEHFQEKIKNHPSKFYLSYGMTETVSHIALRKLNGYDASSSFNVMKNITLSTDEESRLCISAPHLGIDLLKTNDVIKLYSNNTFEFVGRYDNIINSGGLKINTEDIEKQLYPYISKPFYIKGAPDSKLGERVVLFIEDKIWNKKKIEKLKEKFRNLKPKQSAPRDIVFKENFSYTSTGKIIRKI